MTFPGARSPRPGGRPVTTRLALAGLLALPLVELVVAIRVAGGVGPAPTVLLLILLSVSGVLVMRRASGRALQTLAPPGAARPGSPGAARPGSEPDLQAVGDAGWMLAGGLLLVIPGFVTAAVGVLLVFGPTRRVLARLLGRGVAALIMRLVSTPVHGRVVATEVVRGDLVERGTVDGDVVDIRIIPPPEPDDPPEPDNPPELADRRDRAPDLDDPASAGDDPPPTGPDPDRRG